MIASGCFKQDARNIFQTELIYAAALAANCYEIARAESSIEMSRMVERLSNSPICCCVAHVGGRLRSIALPDCARRADATLFRRTRIGVRFDVASLLVHHAA
jgi:hypothetical protein